MTHSFNKVVTIICIKASAKNQLHITAEKIIKGPQSLVNDLRIHVHVKDRNDRESPIL